MEKAKRKYHSKKKYTPKKTSVKETEKPEPKVKEQVKSTFKFKINKNEAIYSQVYRTYPLEEYYKMPKDSFDFYVGSKKIGWMGIIKVNKNKKELTILNTFDP